MKIALILLFVLLLLILLFGYWHEISGFFRKKEKLSNSRIYEREVLKFFTYRLKAESDYRPGCPWYQVYFFSNSLQQYEEQKSMLTEERDYIISKFLKPFPSLKKTSYEDEKPKISTRQLRVDEIEIHLKFLDRRWPLLNEWLLSNRNWSDIELQEKLIDLEELNELISFQNLEYETEIERVVAMFNKCREDEKWELFEQKMLHQMKDLD